MRRPDSISELLLLPRPTDLPAEFTRVLKKYITDGGSSATHSKAITYTPQFQYQKENRQAANHSTGFTGTAAVIG